MNGLHISNTSTEVYIYSVAYIRIQFGIQECNFLILTKLKNMLKKLSQKIKLTIKGVATGKNNSIGKPNFV